jgi:catechol 2,3-dioxygenase-like lactoylglutathione lyase family enzyme
MKRVTLTEVFVHDQQEALDFYVEKLGFDVAEDRPLGAYRWPLVRLPNNVEFCLNLDLARTDEQNALVGRQAADRPLISIKTDDCLGEYQAMRERASSSTASPRHTVTAPVCFSRISSATRST